MVTAPQQASAASGRGNPVFGAARLSGSLVGRPDNRPPLVLLHGLTFDRRMWQPAVMFGGTPMATPMEKS